MATVDFSRLKGEQKNALLFFQSRLGSAVRLKGDQIETEESNNRELKLLTQKFLRRRGLTRYKVHGQAGVLGIFPVDDKRVKSSPSVRGVPPFPPVSAPMLPGMSTVYPNYMPPYQATRKRNRR